MDQEEEMSPFWVQKHNHHHRLRRTYSLLQTTTSYLILLLITTLILTLIVVPTLRSFTSNIFKPQTIKQSWDYLNLILVLFAVVCAFLTKNDNNETQTPRFDNNYRYQRNLSNPETPPFWYEQKQPNLSFNRLRSVGSYPNLRQPSLSVTDDDRYRFFDDTYIRYSRFGDGDEDELHRETATSGEVSPSPIRDPEVELLLDSRVEAVRGNVERIYYQAETVEKPVIGDSVAEDSLLQPIAAVRKKKKSRSESNENVVTVTLEVFTAPSLLQPEIDLQPIPAVRKKKSKIVSKENAATVNCPEALPQLEINLQLPPFTDRPPLMRAKGVRRNVNRTYQSETIEKSEVNDFFADNSQQPEVEVTEVARPIKAERNIGIQVKKKRGNATKEFLTSLRGKKKKQRQKSVENFESLLNSQHSTFVSQPPPPPPPPPPSVFHSLFSSNKSKHKKHYLVPMARESSHYRMKDNVMATGSGNESPLISIPPPPPPPPFKLPAWKFRVQGDYVRVDSIGSSRSDSPDSDEVVESPISQCSNSPYAEAEDGADRATEIGNASGASLFCPSPDVDTKAQNFIQNFRAGLRMAKMNSMKEKQGIGRSNLGPLPNP